MVGQSFLVSEFSFLVFEERLPVARPKPTLARLCELETGQFADFFALLSERTKKETRDGKPYYACRFRDARRTVGFMAWADGGWYEACEHDWQEGQLFKIRGLYGEHEKYGPQIEIQNIRAITEADHSDGFNPADFQEPSRRKPDEMFAELRGLAENHIADLPLRNLVLTLLERRVERFKRLPATTRHFYPYPGGLLEHTLSVTSNCLMLAEKYAAAFPDLSPPLNKDVIVAGAILHDIGRVLEFDDDSGPLVQRTVPGRLVGPIFLGRDLVRDTARELGDVNPHLIELLEHLLVSHLNLLEKDSPRMPMIPEALILHHADSLDAYMEMFVRWLSKDQEPGLFTARDPILGRMLFKNRSL
jgi:3'-5' exoribonuclease